MPSEPADYICIPLPRALANDLARMPEQQRSDLHVLSQMLRKYLLSQKHCEMVHLQESAEYPDI